MNSDVLYFNRLFRFIPGIKDHAILHQARPTHTEVTRVEKCRSTGGGCRHENEIIMSHFTTVLLVFLTLSFNVAGNILLKIGLIA